MNFPEELLYVKSHEWVQKQEDGTYLKVKLLLM